jgi:broad specificity phosphatase PhoE
MTSLFVVRHPQTTWNLEQRYQGRLEAPLSPQGRAEAERVVETFAGEPLESVYSSPLQRARDLAGAIAASADVPLQIDERFTELALGPWQGLYRWEIERRFAELYREWYTRPDRVTFPGGESLADVRQRSQRGLAEILARHPEGTVVLVSHTAVIQSLACAALSIPPRFIHRVRVSNCSISILCGVEPPGSVLSLNVTSHLHRFPVGAASAENCVSWKERRVTL